MTSFMRRRPNNSQLRQRAIPVWTCASFSGRLGLSLLAATILAVTGCQPSDSTTDGNSTAAKAGKFETQYVATEGEAIEPIAADPLDWLQWRGPQSDGTSYETGLIDDFDPEGGEGSNVAWMRDDLGGRSTPVVMNGKLYTLCRAEPATPREGERVVCVDAATGETIWENRFNVYLSDVPDTRVGWSAVVADPETRSVYALGVCGIFLCIDADTGETRWSIPLHEQFGLLSTYGGRTNFPIICDDLVLISAVFINWGDKAKPIHSFLAFDKRTGDVVWFNGTKIGPDDTTYSNPTIAVLNNQKTMVFGGGDGDIWAFQPRTGRALWRVPLSRRGINTPPLVAGDMVYASQSEENVIGTTMGSVIAIDTTKLGAIKPVDSYAEVPDVSDSAIVWRVEELMAGRSQPLLIEDRLWIADDRAKLQLLDASTGDEVGKRVALGRMMRASLLHADGKVYAFESNGRWAIYRPDGDDAVEVVSNGRFSSQDEIHGSPICSHGRVYLQTTGGLYCLVDPSKTPGYTQPPELPQEPPVAEDRKVDHLQVIPAEVLLYPGQKQSFRVRLFNSRGQEVKSDVPVTFSVSEGGSISSSGVLTTPSDATHEALMVTAHQGDLTGTARVRVVPGLPWKFTFDRGEVPVTFVGARYRHVVIDDDLFAELNAKDPMAAQLYLFLHSSFVNSGRPKLTYDNSTPAQVWTGFQRFTGTDETTLEGAKAAIDPALGVLQDAGVIASRTWEDVPDVGVRLSVVRGSRGIEGNGVMTKITTIPKGTRSRAWFGHSNLSDYTIQADVRGAIKDDKMPDIGIVAQGYALDLQGAQQELQIRTWVPQLRMAKTIKFDWKPDVWYTMKLQASNEGDQAVLRGKVWPRGEAEPEAWSLEATDDSPNRAGSPGLFGNAKDAEIFLDNIQVYAN